MAYKYWTKELAAKLPRASDGTFMVRSEPMGKSHSLRFPESSEEWIQAESSRRGITTTELIRECVASQRKAMVESSK